MQLIATPLVWISGTDSATQIDETLHAIVDYEFMNGSRAPSKSHYMLPFCSRDDVYGQCHSLRGWPLIGDAEWLAPCILAGWPAGCDEELPCIIVSAAPFFATPGLRQGENSRTL
jgi:hypothetical protein